MQDFFGGLDAGGASISFLLIGLVLKLSGFAVRDELMLRLLVGGGLAADACYYWFRAEPILPSFLSNVALLAINVALIVAILSERTTWWLSAEDKRLYTHFPTLTPGQFRRLQRLSRTETCAAGAVLAHEGGKVDDLMLVFADTILIAKGSKSFPIAGPAFVGEIAFLTGRPSSAEVTLPEGGRVLRLDATALRRRMARSPSLKNAMVALFGTELARKVADSVPMERAATPSATEMTRAETRSAAASDPTASNPEPQV